MSLVNWIDFQVLGDERGSLVALEVPELDLRRRFSFVWHRGKYHSAAMRRFLEDCRTFTAGAQRSDQIPLPPVA